MAPPVPILVPIPLTIFLDGGCGYKKEDLLCIDCWGETLQDKMLWFPYKTDDFT